MQVIQSLNDYKNAFKAVLQSVLDSARIKNDRK